jgi:UDP-GlcNAc3NAcA epimerase
MSNVFFDQLGMRKPDYLLNNGGGNHGEQTGKMLIEIEAIIQKEKPAGIVVYGDTNSTLAGALVGSKLHYPVYHIEAGLRSFNKKMPEEINRILTDHVSSLLFVPSQGAVENLQNEGIINGVFLVGDIMKDLVKYVIENEILKIKSKNEKYYYVTIHRPYNTDYKARLIEIFENLNSLKELVIFALHPRTKEFAKKYDIKIDQYKNIEFIEPQSYFENLNFLYNSEALITDSGGMQKEAYWLQKKCATIRKETEWTETIDLEGNSLIFDNLSGLEKQLVSKPSVWDPNLYGNGNTAKAIVDKIIEY